jgi:hypothetical protein
VDLLIGDWEFGRDHGVSITGHIYELKPLYNAKNDSPITQVATYTYQGQKSLGVNVQFGTVLGYMDPLSQALFLAPIRGTSETGKPRMYFLRLPPGTDTGPAGITYRPGFIEYAWEDIDDEDKDKTVPIFIPVVDSNNQGGKGTGSSPKDVGKLPKAEAANDNVEGEGAEEVKPAAREAAGPTGLKIPLYVIGGAIVAVVGGLLTAAIFADDATGVGVLDDPLAVPTGSAAVWGANTLRLGLSSAF